MKNLFIEYPKCTTCQKAKKWLDGMNLEYEDRNITMQVPSKKELKDWLNKSGKDIKKWFNTSGLKYKELNLKDKLNDMTDEEKIDLLSRDGMLIKRPILVTEKGVCVSFKEEEWQEII
jgi:arsenate reductase